MRRNEWESVQFHPQACPAHCEICQIHRKKEKLCDRLEPPRKTFPPVPSECLDANASCGRPGRKFATPYVPRQGKDPHGARADMKLVVSGPFESGGFFRFAGDFSSPLRSKSFPFLCKKENMERPRATFMPVFPPYFQPAESIRVHAGPRNMAGLSTLPSLHFIPLD